MSRETESDLRAHWDDRYRSGQTPWDTGVTPPEVRRFWQRQPPPRPGSVALDLGCGAGLNTLFLARQGLRALGLDLSGQAIRLAQNRLRAAKSARALPKSGRALFAQADVSRLPVGRLEAVYALDIGCLHTLPDARRPAYAAGVLRALGRGGHYHLYSFERSDDDRPDARGLTNGEVAALFGDAMEIVAEEWGDPTNQPARRSCWYLLRKAR